MTEKMESHTRFGYQWTIKNNLNSVDIAVFDTDVVVISSAGGNQVRRFIGIFQPI